MKKNMPLLLACALLIAASGICNAQAKYEVIIESENSAPGYSVYRPANLKEAAADNLLPVLVFGNGGCARVSAGYRPLLSTIASNGYIVFAIGTAEETEEQQYHSDHQGEDFMVDAIDWICRESAKPESIYYHIVDTDNVALAGHSCGGAQAMRASYDPRVSTTIMLNSGMGNMTMAGASAANIEELHASILYLIGGPEDVAYPNANLDFEKITNVPVVCANIPVGHGGTYGEPEGGVLGKAMLQWMNWTMKGIREDSRFFSDSEWRKANSPEWDFKYKFVK